MKNGRKSGRSKVSSDEVDPEMDPEILAALESGRPGAPEKAPAKGDPFGDFMEDFYSDPNQPLKFLRSYMAGEEAYNPSVDVLEEKSKLTIVVDLPGVAEKDLKVEFVEGGMMLRGRRPALELPGAKLRRGERPAGDFVKSVPLPRGLDVNRVVAKMDNGVLTLTIPRAAGADAKAIKAGSP